MNVAEIRRPADMERITTPELARSFIDEQIALIKEQVGDKKVLLALSGESATMTLFLSVNATLDATAFAPSPSSAMMFFAVISYPMAVPTMNVLS